MRRIRTLRQFRRLLDIHGADPGSWPASERLRSATLLAGDAQARAARAQAQQLEQWLDHWTPPRDLQAEVRIAASLGSLPAQRRPSWWRRILSDADGLPGAGWFGAAPAAATLAILGLGLVFANFGGHSLDEMADMDLSALVFDSNPSVGLGQ
jgi:hypothetical protein